MPTIEAGTVLAQRYRLERQLGRGGMGEVWAGTDDKLRRPVAVKVMTARIAESESGLQRFEREAMAVARLQSPYIVQVHDYGVDEGRPFIVMELVEGEDLKALLAREKRLSIEDSAKIVVQVAKALHAAHQSGIVHRDLKPGNVFLSHEHDDVIAKVFDFGVAKALTDFGDGTDSDMTGDGQLLGTPRYMSPEQAHGAKLVDHRADLWALAVIAYSCITGRPPFVGAGTGNVLVKICTEEARPPSELIPHLPPEVDAFFEEALAKDPDERFDGARELATQFARLADVSMSTYGLDISDPVPSWPRGPATGTPTDPSGSSLSSLASPIAVPGAPLSDPGAATRAEGSHSEAGVPEAAIAGSGAAGAVAASPRAAPDDGTFGPATTTLAGPASWWRSGRGLLLVALAGALVVGGGVWVALGGGGVDDSRQVPDRAQTAASGEPLATSATVATARASVDPEERDGGAEASEDRLAAGPATGPAAGKAKDVGATGSKKPAAAKPATQGKSSPPPTIPTQNKPAKSKDGLDLFNKRW